ncbi:hypothetical protein [Sinorhizobium sp. RAC02]|uniref:hypothetical protein n=1 Tax=Sinorhizobium sp. RAC02 TaxID=1842534 RepID=UPI00083CDCC6|nr:hypothetical protein [Sinorhizobium sp. RAC02]AOF92806.1 hypothetical protein BSY16_4590 [Sinorhizobium sp. RAC02]
MTSFGQGSGVYEPQDLAAMKVLFDEITSEPWFSGDPKAKKSFAKYLLENYPDGSYDPAKHRSAIEDAARKYFSDWPPGRI